MMNLKTTTALLATAMILILPNVLADDPRAETQDYETGWEGENNPIEHCDSSTGNFCFDFHDGDSSVRLAISDLTNAATTSTGGGYIFHDGDHNAASNVEFFCQDSGDVAIPSGATHIHAVVAGPLLTALIPACALGSALPATSGSMTAHYNGHS